jgi:hypothetical protein
MVAMSRRDGGDDRMVEGQNTSRDIALRTLRIS